MMKLYVATTSKPDNLLLTPTNNEHAKTGDPTTNGQNNGQANSATASTAKQDEENTSGLKEMNGHDKQDGLDDVLAKNGQMDLDDGMAERKLMIWA